MTPEVTVIMPLYNNSDHVEESIKSVQQQTLTDFEIVVVDDCSKDNSVLIVKKMADKDKRIKLFGLNENSGAAIARNVALKESKGRFIAFLDADDLWKPDKLEKQVKFMKENKYAFSCTSYEVIDNQGNVLNKQITMKSMVTYKGFLENNLLQTVGILVDTKYVDHKLIEMPDYRTIQDAATWLQILKAGHACYGMEEVLSFYRRVPGSLSSNKFKAVYGVWYLYRKIEKLSFIYSCYIFTRYASLAVWKRLYLGRS